MEGDKRKLTQKSLFLGDWWVGGPFKRNPKQQQKKGIKHISLHFFMQFTVWRLFFAAEHEKKLFFTTKASGKFLW
jgi:hypothetical protein